MVIIWRGYGWLVAAIVFGLSLAANLTFNAICGEGYYDSHNWPFALSLLVSSAICWFLGNYLKTRSDRVVIDKKTGKEFVLSQSRHTLFLIPVHLWAPVLALIAAIVLVLEFAHHWIAISPVAPGQ